MSGEPIADSLKKFKRWLKRKAPELHEAFAPPATDTQLRQLEEKFGTTLPDDVRVFYLTHDGAPDSAMFPSATSGEMAYGPMSLAEVEESWASAQKFDSFSPGLVPIASNGGGDFQCVDVSPDPDKRGRIVEVLHETREEAVVAPAFSAFLAELVDGLNARRYRFDEENGIVRVDPSAPPPAKRKSKASVDDSDGLWHALRLVQEESPSGAYWPIPPSPELAAALKSLDPDGQYFSKAPGARLTALFKLRVHGAGEFFKYAEPKGVIELNGLRFYPIREVVQLNKDHWVPPPKRWPLIFATTLAGNDAVCFDLTRDDANPPIVLYPASFALAKKSPKQLAAAGRVIANDLLDFLGKLERSELDVRV